METDPEEVDISVNEEEKFSLTDEKMKEMCEDNKLVSDLLKRYPHDLQMYRNVLTGNMPLQELEQLAAERFEVLRLIDYLSKEAEIQQEEFKESLLSTLGNKGFISYTKLITSPGCDSNTIEDLEARERDHISHFILRASFSKVKSKYDWLVRMETILFKTRYQSLNENGIQQFLVCNDFNFPIHSKEEVAENRENLLLIHDNIDFENTVFYKIPYLEVRNLVRDRKIFIKEGIAFLPSTEILSVISQTFKDSFYKEYKYFREVSKKDKRLVPIFNNLLLLYEKSKPFAESQVTLDSLDMLAETSYPLCMKTMHEALRQNHHLRNDARFQYGLFLKVIGLEYESAIDFWKEEFIKKMDLLTFDKEYTYNIRYVYGKVGKKADYNSIGCEFLIKSRIGFGEYHGCPYKNMSSDILHSSLLKLGLSESGIADIEDLVHNSRYKEACSNCFFQKNKTHLPKIVSSPVIYFENSQELHSRRKRIEEVYSQSLLEDRNETSRTFENRNGTGQTLLEDYEDKDRTLFQDHNGRILLEDHKDTD